MRAIAIAPFTGLVFAAACTRSVPNGPAAGISPPSNSSSTTVASAVQGSSQQTTQKVALAAANATQPGAASSGTPIGIPDSQLLRLSNGLRVILHVDPEQTEVSVHTAYQVGERDEAQGVKGISRLASYLMFQGSKNAPGPFGPRLEKMGADANSRLHDAVSDSDRTITYAQVPEGALEYALWLESDRMGFLADSLDQATLDRTKEALLSRLRQNHEQPQYLLSQMIGRYVYPSSHPYAGVEGNEESAIKNLTLADVQQWLRRHHTPNNATLTISGRFQVETAKTLIDKYFSGLAPGSSHIRSAPSARAMPEDVSVDLRQTLTPLTKLTLIWPTSAWLAADDAPLRLAQKILSEGADARLFKLLVLEKRLANHVSAHYEARELGGYFIVEVSTPDPRTLPEIEPLLLRALDNLAEQGPSEAELDARKASYELEFARDLERLSGIQGRSDRLSHLASMTNDANALAKDLARHLTVSKADVSKALKTHIAGRPKLVLRSWPDTSKAVSDTTERQREPSVATAAAYVAPKVEASTLANGMGVTVVRKGGLGKIDFAVVVKMGDIAEDPNSAGVSYLTAAAVGRATKTRSRLEIETQLSQLGSVLSVDGGKFGSVLAMSSLKRHLGDSLELAADLVRHPAFAKEDVEALKQLRIGQMRVERQNSLQVTADLLPKILFAGGHPMGLPDRGYYSSINNMTPEQLTAHHQKFWVPSNTVLVVVGDTDLKEVEALAQKHFASWTGEALPKLSIAAGQSPDKNYLLLVDSPGNEAHIRLMGLASSRYGLNPGALDLLSHILGGSYESRLVANMRQDNIAASNVYSQLVQNMLGGYWLMAATVAPDSASRAVLAMHKAVTDLLGSSEQNTAINDDELARAKRTLGQRFVAAAATQSGILQRISLALSSGGSAEQGLGFGDDLANSKLEDLKTLASKVFDQNRLIAVVVGDLKKIEGPLAAMKWADTLVVSDEGVPLRRAEPSKEAEQPAPAPQAPATMMPAGMPPPAAAGAAPPPPTPQAGKAQDFPPGGVPPGPIAP